MLTKSKRFIIFSLIIIIASVGYFLYIKDRNIRTYEKLVETNDPTAVGLPLIKHVGFNLDEFNEETQSAGDIKFTETELGRFDAPIIDFGLTVPESSASPEKVNPQPTFYLPLGTKVRSLIDGVVVKVEEIYSGDFTIHIAQTKSSLFIFETEHVINPTVKVGDMVNAGDIIAEVSDYEVQNSPGYGVLEIGILMPGDRYIHICPFKYLDESIKEKTYNDLNSVYKAWNKYRNVSFYTEDLKVPGCISEEAVIE